MEILLNVKTKISRRSDSIVGVAGGSTRGMTQKTNGGRNREGYGKEESEPSSPIPSRLRRLFPGFRSYYAQKQSPASQWWTQGNTQAPVLEMVATAFI